MSFFVLAIAAGHALPPILGAVVGKSESGVMVGAVVGVVIAVAFGSGAYLMPDLIGVALGTWVGFSVIKGEQKNE